MAEGLIPWGEGHHDDLPEKINRVTLDPVLKDGTLFADFINDMLVWGS